MAGKAHGNHSPHFSTGRSCAVMLVAAILLGIAVWQATLPIKQLVAKRYVARGDTYFIHLQFTQAAQQYADALKYDSNLTEASDREEQAVNAETNVASGRALFLQLGQTDMVSSIDEATKPYSDPAKALAAGVAFFNNAQYEFAQYPLRQAVQIDPNYPEAWNYLALTYDQLVSSSSLYTALAKGARTHRDALTPKWIGQ